MKKFIIAFTFVMMLLLIACNGKNGASLLGDTSNNGNNSSNAGFGVSGLLFENNLVMYDRDNTGSRSELFPQIYFTRADAANFPVWGSFPMNRIVSGGVPRDGIPALTNPKFVEPSSAEARYVRSSDLVLGAVVNGEAKAYPENILWWHEIVNDVIAGQKVMMTFCPLTGTGLFFRAPSHDTNFDRLELLPVIGTTWEKWKQLFPSTTVISQNTGFSRNYTAYPYGDYREEQTLPLFPLRTRSLDARFPPKHVVLGLIEGSVQKAYPFSRLAGKSVVNDNVNSREVVIISDLAAKLVIPYDRKANGRVLSFKISSENPFQMTDNETGSVWNIKGEALSGPLAGAKLSPIPAYNAFWFAWAVFWPSTQVFE
ncbi:MAG: DUF3179 domain-containing protein [bacterium]